MIKKDVVFVVLNYMNKDDTVECINSIITNIDTDSFHIVCVDNNSPNDSGQQLQSEYKNNAYVTVLLNNENKGYSEGCNYGIRYARQTFEFDFLLLLNNDIIFLETDFYTKTKYEFDQSRFAVMGPMIMTPQGRCDANPLFDLPYTRKLAIKDKKFYIKKKKLLKCGLWKIYTRVHAISKRLFPFFYPRQESRRHRWDGSYLNRQENVVLHGCFFVLSRVFFEHFDQLDVRSFMYAEEDILYMHITEQHLTIVYNPSIIVYHKGDGATKKMNKSSKKSEIFRCDKSIEAIDGYITLLDELNIE